MFWINGAEGSNGGGQDCCGKENIELKIVAMQVDPPELCVLEKLEKFKSLLRYQNVA